jgi:hypothetical protein
MPSNMGDLQKKIEASVDSIPQLTADAELLAAQAADVQLLLRTFATGGKGVKDINGNNLKPYVKPKLVQGKRGLKKDKHGTWAEKRLKAGLQIDNKDLIFSSDTSVIKDNIAVGTASDKPALGFTKSDGALIAGYQEEQNKTQIFQLNDGERENVNKQVKGFIMEGLKKMVESWH